MFSENLIEKRLLMKPKLGPADVYLQEIWQKEDELTSMSLKHGFMALPQISEEFGTARNCNVTASNVGEYFNAIQAKKEELLTFTDSRRKKYHVKVNLWPLIKRAKRALEFKDLAGKNISNFAVWRERPCRSTKRRFFRVIRKLVNDEKSSLVYQYIFRLHANCVHCKREETSSVLVVISTEAYAYSPLLIRRRCCSLFS